MIAGLMLGIVVGALIGYRTTKWLITFLLSTLAQGAL